MLRDLDDTNPDLALASLEAQILDESNRLEIGPMGFGGKLTVGSCKIGAQNRLPASFFVSVAYMCWAYRRRGVVLDAQGEVVEWLYTTPGEFDHDYSKDTVLLDLAYEEDSQAEVDMNVVMTEDGGLVEVQATAEKAAFARSRMLEMMDLAEAGIRELLAAQRAAIAEERAFAAR